MKKIAGIYKITSPSGKVYIGQSWDIAARFKNHRCIDNSNCTLLINSLKKHGIKNHKFEIIHELPKDAEQLTMDVYEILYISHYKALGFLMLNIRDGGLGGKMTDETRNKMRLSHTGKKHKPETIEKYKNRKASAETKAKMSCAFRGRKISEQHKILISNANKSRVCTVETKQKISLSLMGRVFSEQHRKRLSESNSRRTLSDETKKKIGIKSSMRNHSEETRKKMSVSRQYYLLNKS